MIDKETLIVAGKITKTHGIKGEVSVLTHFDVFENEFPYIVFEMDGILVPFFIEEIRIQSSSSAYLKFENIDSDKKSQELVGKNVYVPKDFVANIDEKDMELDHLIGFEIEDETRGVVGSIIAIEDSTANVLFVLSNKRGEEILIPVADEYIQEILLSEKKIKMVLPSGILEM